MNNFDPFQHMKQFQQYFDHFFKEDFWANFQNLTTQSINQLKVNLYESGYELVVAITLPGLKSKDDISIFIDEKLIEIEGQMKFNLKGYRTLQEEATAGNFKRSIELPYAIRKDRVETVYRKGILFIHCHRLLTQNDRQKIAIQSIDDEDLSIEK
ncbi:Hsp20/alpha crystallin family protein [Alkalihalobacillus sp. BA299]|uniref:Hsp20/alpha crystallin family protein n=1 Tax=Alkalihalobacillus sp. BA299 TaxID=2815938 RepID=UPI001ADD5F34|nr:Hsp20/alpha crystallin family protein [Alkalihalobacillus sp. BA299]